MKENLFKAVLWFLTLFAPLPLFASSQCEPLSSLTKNRLEQYVHDRFQMAPPTVVELIDSQQLGDTCYRKVYFRRSDTLERIMMFLSSDQRFLSGDLFDSTVDLSEQVKDEQLRLRAELTKGDFPVKGRNDAPVTIVLFSDFQCPYCKRQAEIMKREFSESEVRLIFRNLPLPMHPWAALAAESARCVYEQDGNAFWDLHDSLFQNQDQLTLDNIQTFIHTLLSKRSDVQGTIYEACLSSHRATPDIERDVKFATEHNIHATPTLFINGVRLEGVRRAQEIRGFISPSGQIAK